NLYIENQRFKLLFDSTQDFILQIDDTHHIVFASGKGLAKINHTAESLIGKKTNILWHDAKIEHEHIIDDALEGKHSIYDWEIVINNQNYTFETSISPMYNQDKSIISAVL